MIEEAVTEYESVESLRGFLGGSDGKESACNERPRLIPGLGRSPGEGNAYPLQYSCLENFMDREAWWAAVHRVIESPTELSNKSSIYLLRTCYASSTVVEKGC